jgi:hypothetical protein
MQASAFAHSSWRLWIYAPPPRSAASQQQQQQQAADHQHCAALAVEAMAKVCVHERLHCLNDAPCPPLTSHGASIMLQGGCDRAGPSSHRARQAIAQQRRSKRCANRQHHTASCFVGYCALRQADSRERNRSLGLSQHP